MDKILDEIYDRMERKCTVKKVILGKFKESLLSVIPATIIILIVAIFIGVPFYDPGQGNNNLVTFLVSAILLIFGLTLFTLGAENSMLMIAERIGNTITKKKSWKFLVIVGFLIGFLITIAEPALWVLSDQFPAVETLMLLTVVGLGVAVFLVISLLRIVFQFRLRTIIIVCYSIIFAFVFFVPIIKPEFINFVPFAFDSSGVTTGPMAVPFIMSLGLGVSSSRNDKNAEKDSFGLVGVASIGPIFAVLILGIFYGASAGDAEASLTVLGYLMKYFVDMSIAIVPFVLFFIVFQIFSFRMQKKQMIKVFVAFLYTYLGLVLFLTGASAGFVAIGDFIGSSLAIQNKWLLIPIGMMFGAVIVSAEPSVIVLNQQVSDVTAGAINKKIMGIFMAIGMALAIGLSMLRITTGMSLLWIVTPGYIIAVILSFFAPKMFTAIAFDSGGAVSGAMTSTFLVALALGATRALNGNILLDAFGLVALVAMMPLITIQILGIIYRVKQKKLETLIQDDEIIEFNY